MISISSSRGFLLAALVLAAETVVGLTTETNYAFRARMAEVHPLRLQADAEPLRADEVRVRAPRISVAAATSDPDGVLAHAAADLRDYFAKSLREPTDGESGTRIVIGVDSSLRPLQSKVAVTNGTVFVTGVTPREAAQGCYRIEDELTARGASVVKTGERTYTRLYSPRMVHSGYEIEKFPDWHMDQIAHAGMDAILVFVSEPPDGTRNGRVDMPALVKRAARHGLDVYAYFDRFGHPLEKDPTDEGAEQYYDGMFGSIVKNAPGLKGLILVGESCPVKKSTGFYPSYDWPSFLSLVAKVTRRYRPDFDVVFWTYNWYWAPEKDRLPLLERIPTNVTLHVTYEMGDVKRKRCGVDDWIEDYSIVRPGPGTTFVSEAAVARRRGIRLTSMTNTGGRTWDFGGAPYEPVPYSWLDRFAALKTSREKYGLSGLMEAHHYGFTPNFIAEIAKCAFTEETTAADMERCLEAIAARDFGRANVKAVLGAWRDWSDAMKWHSARVFDQWGVLRVGPTYPFTFYGEKVPDPPAFFGADVGRKGGRWTYLSLEPPKSWPAYEKEVAAYTEMAAKELPFWRAGNAKLEAALKAVPADRRDAAARMLGIGKYCEHSVRTSLNMKRFWQAKTKAEWLAILDDEAENVRGLIPYVETDSQLGWEPTMRYVADRRSLEWKLGQLDGMRKRIEGRALDFK